MSLEFDLIQEFFQRGTGSEDVSLGIGDDAAIVEIPAGAQLVVTTDTLVEGGHFFKNDSAEDIGYKSLAVNLSDLAAMGATPKWFTLSLSMPIVNKAWLASFAKGLFILADKHAVSLVGGDTTKGPLNICIQALGIVSAGQAITRSNAVTDDDIYVTGTLGDAALGLLTLQNRTDLVGDIACACQARLRRPTPRVDVGMALQNNAHAMIDCSDGFAADLGHLLSASNKTAEIWLEKIPMSNSVSSWVATHNCWDTPLAGGDDYELIFTSPAEKRETIEALGLALSCPFSRVGKITNSGVTQYYHPDGQVLNLTNKGYSHF
ncbi:MAG: thiamine-phosphate kinase [Thiothrix sp.]|nr:MAG: thiamine-phosphate kinase [Thiothrix sp.]